MWKIVNWAKGDTKEETEKKKEKSILQIQDSDILYPY